MSLYLFPANTTPALPVGTAYRVLSSRDDLLNGNHILQTECDCECALEQPSEDQLMILGDISGCIASYDQIIDDKSELIEKARESYDTLVPLLQNADPELLAQAAALRDAIAAKANQTQQ